MDEGGERGGEEENGGGGKGGRKRKEEEKEHGSSEKLRQEGGEATARHIILSNLEPRTSAYQGDQGSTGGGRRNRTCPTP